MTRLQPKLPNKPRAPKVPTAPSETIIQPRKLFCSLQFYAHKDEQNIINQIASLLDDTEIQKNTYNSKYNFFSKPIEIPNPNLKFQLQKYKEELEIHEKQKIIYEEKLKAYEAKLARYKINLYEYKQKLVEEYQKEIEQIKSELT